MINIILFLTLFALLNRARGSRLFDHTNSTLIGRLVSMLGMSIALAAATGSWTVLIWSWGALMFWCTFAWDKYWAAASGNRVNMASQAFAPVDWIMRKWPASTDSIEGRRYWGLTAMGLRQSLAAPFIIGLAFLSGHPGHAWLAIFTPLLAVPYFIFGLINKDTAIPHSEFALGALLGALALLVIY